MSRGRTRGLQARHREQPRYRRRSRKLTDCQVLAIAASDESVGDLARRYAVDHGTVRKILSGKMYGKLTGIVDPLEKEIEAELANTHRDDDNEEK